MLFCNAISLNSNSHGFTSWGGEVGGGGGGVPPTAKNLLITPHMEIFTQ